MHKTSSLVCVVGIIVSMCTTLVCVVGIIVSMCTTSCSEVVADGKMSSEDDMFHKACSYRIVYESVLADIKAGMPISDYINIVHTLGQHEITFQMDDGKIMSIYSIYIIKRKGEEQNVDNEVVWTVFCDNHLIKTTHYVNHSTMDGLIDFKSKSADLGSLINSMKARALKSLAGTEYKIKDNNVENKTRTDPGLSLAFSLLGHPIIASVKRDRVINYQRLIKYSGDNVHIGDDLDKSERLFGSASGRLIDSKSQGFELRQYGDTVSLNVAPQDLSRPLIVIYKEDKVLMTLNNEFYLECVGY